MKIYTHRPIELQDLDSVTGREGRFYKTPSGVSYPSVTTVLAAHTKAGIMQWREQVGAEVADKISRQAATRGTKFHNMAEKYLNNQPVEASLNMLERELFEMAKPELHKIDNIILQEQALYSKHLRIAGRVDCIGEYEGKLSVIDFKTARKEKDPDHVQHYFMQAAAYAIMCEELTKIPVSKLVLIVAVEDGFMQVFEGKRNDYVKQLLYYRDLYEANN